MQRMPPPPPPPPPPDLQQVSQCIYHVGDSITQHIWDDDSDDPTRQQLGWRCYLAQTLHSNGYAFKTTGSNTKRNFQTSPEHCTNFGGTALFHDGYASHTSTEVWNKLRPGGENRLGSFLASNRCKPTCVTVHLGTNDMVRENTNTLDADMNAVLANINLILEEIRRQVNQPITALIAAPIKGDPVGNTNSLNQPIPLWKQRRLVALGDKIKDLENVITGPLEKYHLPFNTAFTSVYNKQSQQDTLRDWLHPNNVGHLQMSDLWFDAISQHCYGIDPT
jgi:hypothetical protein